MFNVKSMSKIVRRVSVYDLNMYERTHATVWKIIKTKTAYTRVTGCVLCEWRREKRLERDARVRARAFLSPSSPSSLFFSSSEYSIPLSFVAPLLLFLFLFSFSSCVYTHARFCVLYISPRTLRLHEAARGTFFSLHLQILLLYASRLLQATSLFTASTFVYVLFLSLWAKVSCIYIYISIHTYIIYICICVYNCFCRFSHVSHRFLPWPTSLKKLFGYEKETKRENRPADEREKEM